MCALGADLKGRSFTSLFCEADREDITDILGIVADETQATVAGLSAFTWTVCGFTLNCCCFRSAPAPTARSA
jgi:hypothetical protein